jgi:hypothetical protein
MQGLWGLQRGGGGVALRGAAVLVPARAWCAGTFWVRLLMGSGGGTYTVWTGTGAPGDKGNERSSPCIYLPTWQSHLACLACHNPAEPMEFASDCDPSFSPRRRGFVLHPGLNGWWGEGAVFPPPAASSH